MLRVALLNPKGGCGKTTIATNLACGFANRGRRTALFDFDSQGSSTQWLAVRSPELPAIHGIPAYKDAGGSTRAWRLRVPGGTDRVVIDTPASVNGPQLDEIIRRADRIVVPLLASPIDFEAFINFAPRLAKAARIRSGDVRVGVVVNRVRRDTRYYRALDNELSGVLGGGPFEYLTALRDTQNYVRAGTRGCGVAELNTRRAEADLIQWIPLLGWLGEEPPAGLSPAPDAHDPSERRPEQRDLDLGTARGRNAA